MSHTPSTNTTTTNITANITTNNTTDSSIPSASVSTADSTLVTHASFAAGFLGSSSANAPPLRATSLKSFQTSSTPHNEKEITSSNSLTHLHDNTHIHTHSDSNHSIDVLSRKGVVIQSSQPGSRSGSRPSSAARKEKSILGSHNISLDSRRHESNAKRATWNPHNSNPNNNNINSPHHQSLASYNAVSFAELLNKDKHLNNSSRAAPASLNTSIDDESATPELARVDSILRSLSAGQRTFNKALTSDVDNSTAQQYFAETSRQNPLFTMFTAEDLTVLSEVFSVLHFTQGDKIIEQNEDATFVGIILKGQFNAIVSDKLVVKLFQGDMLGEQALFEGGVRNATVIANQDCILAVISFEELKNLSELEPQLSRKLLFLFASASIQKIRKLKAGQNQSQSAKSQEVTAPATPTGAIDTSQPHSPTNQNQSSNVSNSSPSNNINNNAHSASTVPNVDVKAKPSEFLYRARAKPNTASNADNDSNKEGKTVETEQSKRLKVEHKLRNLAVKLENTLKKMEKLEIDLQQSEIRNKHQEKTIHERESTIESLTETKSEQKLTIQNLQVQLDESISKYQSLQSEILDVKATAGQAFEPRLNSLNVELSQSKADYATLSKNFQTILKEKDELQHKLSHSHSQLSDRDIQLQVAEVMSTELKSTAEGLTNKNNEFIRALTDHKSYITQLQAQLRESEENLLAVLPWKNKANEYLALLDNERNRNTTNRDYVNQKVAELEIDCARYRKVLQVLTISVFMKEFKLKRVLCSIHRQISDLLLLVLEEQYVERNKTKQVGSNQQIVHQLKLEIKLLKKRKFQMIDGFLSHRAKPLAIAQSMETDIQKMKFPMEDLQTTINQWKSTSEAFFNRNIELMNSNLIQQKTVQKQNQQIDALTQTINEGKQVVAEKEGKIQELNGRISQNKQELDKLEKQLRNQQKQFQQNQDSSYNWSSLIQQEMQASASLNITKNSNMSPNVTRVKASSKSRNTEHKHNEHLHSTPSSTNSFPLYGNRTAEHFHSNSISAHPLLQNNLMNSPAPSYGYSSHNFASTHIHNHPHSGSVQLIPRFHNTPNQTNYNPHNPELKEQFNSPPHTFSSPIPPRNTSHTNNSAPNSALNGNNNRPANLPNSGVSPFSPLDANQQKFFLPHLSNQSEPISSPHTARF